MNPDRLQISLFISCLIISTIQATYPISECGQESQLKCKNGGVCIRIELDKSSFLHVCQCKLGFTGAHCEQSLHPCDPDPCQPNGFCNSVVDSDFHKTGYHCRCKPGFFGPNCEINRNDCINATCFNGGLCIDGVNSYECECQWPYFGRYCQIRMTCQSIPNICKNNGVCIEDTNGPVCECQPGFTGQDCSIKMDRCSENHPEFQCYHGSECINRLDVLEGFECKCRPGYIGKYCQYKDVCATLKPCKNNSTCVNSINYNSSQTTNDESAINYSCHCLDGYEGDNCEIKKNCTGNRCQSMLRMNTSIPYKLAQQSRNFRDHQKPSIDQHDLISENIKPQEASIYPKISVTEQNESVNQNKNGSFVLILNIDPVEFKRRKNEIIAEFEKRFGILMLIKKDPKSSNEMIYPYYPNSSTGLKTWIQNSKILTWTKVHFIIIFACVTDQPKDQNSLCLENNIQNLNDAFGILSEFKKVSNLMPDYVNNISYEAYADSRTQPTHVNENKISQYLTFTIGISLLVLFLVINFLLGVLVRQHIAKRVRAPVWYPPLGDNPYSEKTCNGLIEMEPSKSKKMMTSAMNCQPLKSENSWSLNKTFESIAGGFLGGRNHIYSSGNNMKTTDDSPPSSDSGRAESEYGDYSEVYKPPSKMRKVGECEQIVSSSKNYLIQNSSGSSSCTLSSSASNSSQNPLIKDGLQSISFAAPFPPILNIDSNQLNTNRTSSPEYYPSPPESLPDAVSFQFQNNQKLNKNRPPSFNQCLSVPVNYKAANYGITPLMAFVMGCKPNASAVDKYVQSGADLNSQNEDGDTALHIACRNGHSDIAERLINAGADLVVFNNAGLIPFHVAVCANQIQIVRSMLEYCKFMCETHEQQHQQDIIQANQSINQESNFNIIDLKADCIIGDTALIMAVRNNLIDMVRLLIQYKANVNAIDNEGQSALHYCAKVNNYEAATILIHNGAQVGMQDINDKTPLSLALAEYGGLETAEVLMQNEAYMTNEDHAALEKKKSSLEQASLHFTKVLPPSFKLPNESNSTKSKTSYNIQIVENSAVKRKLSDVVPASGLIEFKNGKIPSKKGNKTLKSRTKTDKSSNVSQHPSVLIQTTHNTQKSEYKETCLDVDYANSYSNLNSFESSKFNQMLNCYDYCYPQQSHQLQNTHQQFNSNFHSNKFFGHENLFECNFNKFESSKNYGAVENTGFEYSVNSNEIKKIENESSLSSQSTQNSESKHQLSRAPIILNGSNVCFNSGSTDAYAAYF